MEVAMTPPSGRMSLNLLMLILSYLAVITDAFVVNQPTTFGPAFVQSKTSLSATLSAVDARRKVLLSRNGPYFDLNRSEGQIAFGATANLVTQLDGNPQGEDIAEWLTDERSLALSIWDNDLIQEKGDNVYRLQIMSLQFVTIKLQPWVDTRMKTVKNSKGNPVFTLQSVDFDPNVQIIPGISVSAETLGIVIEVAGQLQASADGKSVTGKIAFQTSGKLPGLLRVVPESALKSASDTINNTVVNFVVQNFQTGAKNNFASFLRKRGETS
jgi:hypothetical protein